MSTPRGSTPLRKPQLAVNAVALAAGAGLATYFVLGYHWSIAKTVGVIAAVWIGAVALFWAQLRFGGRRPWPSPPSS